jgi:hypothetical protein
LARTDGPDKGIGKTVPTPSEGHDLLLQGWPQRAGAAYPEFAND